MNPLLLDFPTMFQTKRIQIRKPFPGDGAELFEVLQLSADDLRPWLSYGTTITTEEQAEADVREAHAKFLLREELRFHLYVKEESTFIGMVTLHPIDWSIGKFLITFWLASNQLHNGYMTEALNGITKFAFEKLHSNRLEIRLDSRNENARQVVERTNFTLEGTLRRDQKAYDSDKLCDTCIYAKIKEDETKTSIDTLQ